MPVDELLDDFAVDCFRKNRPEDAEIPLLGPDGVFDSRAIRLADLKGNVCVHPEADETFPRLKSQQRGVLTQLFAINDPVIQRALTEPANLGYMKNVLGLSEMVIPGEDSRNKQLREIQQLLSSAPIVLTLPHEPVAQAFRPEAFSLDGEAPAPKQKLGTMPDAVAQAGVAQAFRPEAFSSPEAATGNAEKPLTPEGVSYSGQDRSSPAAHESRVTNHESRITDSAASLGSRRRIAR